MGRGLEAMKAWDDHVASQNYAASIRANHAWHTSSLWVQVMALESIVSSTAVTVAISVAIGFFGMVLFTRSCLLAMLSIVSVLLIVISLLFFMVAVMQWPIGAIEVVALIVFLGYMFTFNLHISHAYMHGPVMRGPRYCSGWLDAQDPLGLFRFQKTRYALVAMGQSLLGSAMTSAGCSIFLVFCTLQFFVKFGLVILLVTTLSLVYALLFLPALLMIAGPTPYSCCCCGGSSAAKDAVLRSHGAADVAAIEDAGAAQPVQAAGPALAGAEAALERGADCVPLDQTLEEEDV